MSGPTWLLLQLVVLPNEGQMAVEDHARRRLMSTCAAAVRAAQGDAAVIATAVVGTCSRGKYVAGRTWLSV